MILSPHQQDVRPDVSLLMTLGEAVQERRRVAITYSSYRGEVTQRELEPYGVVGWKGHWYVVGHCCLRQAYRLFRLDRLRSVHLLTETFVRAEDFDCHDYVVKRLATIPARWRIEVEFQAELYIVQQKIPAAYGQLTATPTGVLYQSHHNDLSAMACYLIGLALPFTIHQPPELRDALMHLAEQMVQIAQA